MDDPFSIWRLVDQRLQSVKIVAALLFVLFSAATKNTPDSGICLGLFFNSAGGGKLFCRSAHALLPERLNDHAGRPDQARRSLSRFSQKICSEIYLTKRIRLVYQKPDIDQLSFITIYGGIIELTTRFQRDQV